MIERIILGLALLASCVGQQQEDKAIAEWIIVAEDEYRVCLKETEDSEVQCYDKLVY